VSNYSFLEHENSDFYAVKFNEGKYAGVTVIYGTVSIKEDGDGAVLKYTFSVQDPGSYDLDTLNASEEFKNYLGDMLQNIIRDSIENFGGKIGSESTD
jgi:hypothetical protein